MQVSEEQFQKNVGKWAIACPNEAQKILSLDCPRVQLCKTGEGYLNLKRDKDCYHYPEDPMKEANEWFKSLDLYNIETLFVWGVGLGYYYQAAKDWLSEKPTRFIIFFEYDLEVIRQLLETELGSEFIHDRQSWLQYVPKIEDGKEAYKVQAYIDKIPLGLIVRDHRISGLTYYLNKHPVDYLAFHAQFEHVKNLKIFRDMELMKFGEGFFKNYYRNVFELPEAYSIEKMSEQFKGVPAIICGAGPSLNKNLNVLETLKNKALIFAGGTAMNTVNLNGFLPHFGAGVDPNLTQYNRLFMNQAFLVPYFCQNRMYSEALRIIHGDHIYTGGESGYKVAEWLEDKLDIPHDTIDVGHNVINFTVSLAKYFGCNPIILVGLDLAYTNGESYAKGVYPHPLKDVNEALVTRTRSEEVITKPDIDGNPTTTLWKWVMESAWYSQMAVTNPRLRIVNATEGGLGFDGIPNMTLKEAAEKYLKREYDLDGIVHGVIQSNPVPSEVTKEKIESVYQEMIESLKTCRNLCKNLRKEFTEMIETIKATGESPPNLITEKALGWIRELNQEPAFHAVLTTFNESFLSIYGKKDLDNLYSSQDFINQSDIDKIRLFLHKRRFEFLKAVSDSNLNTIQNAISEERVREIIKEALSSEKAPTIESGAAYHENEYQSAEDQFTIDDNELNIHYTGELNQTLISPEETDSPQLITDPNVSYTGKFIYDDGIKVVQYYHENRLHGPSTVFNEKGDLLSRTWYVEGVRQGKACFYYPNGQFHSIKRYTNGKKTAKQTYFYPDGKLKAVLNYSEGQLDGTQYLLFDDNVTKRKIEFKKGKREGKEEVWNIGGIKEASLQFKNNRPVGICRSWYTNGKLSREFYYDEDSNLVKVKGWTSDGIALPEESLVVEDYFSKVTKQTETLTSSLDGMTKQIGIIMPFLKKDTVTEKEESQGFESDLNELKAEMEKLKKIQNDINEKVEEKKSSSKDQSWNTPETQRLLGKQLEETTMKMADDILALEEALKLTIDLIDNREDENQ